MAAAKRADPSSSPNANRLNWLWLPIWALAVCALPACASWTEEEKALLVLPRPSFYQPLPETEDIPPLEERQKIAEQLHNSGENDDEQNPPDDNAAQ